MATDETDGDDGHDDIEPVTHVERHPTLGPAAVVTPRANGPLVVDGPVTVTAPDGTTTTVQQLFLCRCGASSTKPTCDGSHKRIGFSAPGVVPTSRSGPRSH